MSEKSDPDYVPDEAEPEDNIPDAVRDWSTVPSERWPTEPAADFTQIPDAQLFSVDVYGGNIFINTHRGGFTFDEAVRLANAILSEVEVAQRGGL